MRSIPSHRDDRERFDTTAAELEEKGQELIEKQFYIFRFSYPGAPALVLKIKINFEKLVLVG